MSQFVKECLNNELIRKNKLFFSYSALIFLLSFIVLLAFSREIIKVLELQVPFNVHFQQEKPFEIFNSSLKITFLTGIFLTSPVITFFAYKYNFKNLRKLNKQILFNHFLALWLLFLTGASFACFILIRPLLFFLLGFTANLASINLNLADYISFCLELMFISGLIFSFPVLPSFFANTSLIDSKDLVKHFKQAAITAVIITLILVSPPELITILLISFLIITIYSLSILITAIIE